MTKCTCLIENDMRDRILGKMVQITNPLARVSHKCVECSGKIKKGERYECVEGKWDGSWEIIRTCEACAEIRNCLVCWYIYGQTWADIEGYVLEEDLPFCALDQLSQAARTKMIKWFDERML